MNFLSYFVLIRINLYIAVRLTAFVIMILNMEPVNNWFGFTRRERRASSILLVIMLMIICIRYVVPEKNMEIEITRTGYSDTYDLPGKTEADNSIGSVHFAFDPNSASLDTLIRLGFTSRQAGTLISYRKKGGKIKRASDITKVYGIDSTLASSLVPYIVISAGGVRKTDSGTVMQPRHLLDINSCDSASLVLLPGIGPVLSARIIKYRKMLGGFASTEQLKEVYGLQLETFDLIKDRLYADSSLIRKIKINSAGYSEISRLPYIAKYEISAILKYRELKGRINGIGDLTDNKLLTPDKAEKAEPYLDFE
jgi:competence protein ComEA